MLAIKKDDNSESKYISNKSKNKNSKNGNIAIYEENSTNFNKVLLNLLINKLNNGFWILLCMLKS